MSALASSVRNDPPLPRASSIDFALGFLTWPADGRGGAAGPIDNEVCDPCDVQAWRARGLRQEHRAELARSDQTNADRLSRSRPFGQFRRHAHGQLVWQPLDSEALRAQPSAQLGLFFGPFSRLAFPDLNIQLEGFAVVGIGG
jgi:hypothetical protein